MFLLINALKAAPLGIFEANTHLQDHLTTLQGSDLEVWRLYLCFCAVYWNANRTDVVCVVWGQMC